MALANVRFLTLRQVADTLSISPNSVKSLRDKGLLTDVSQRTGRTRVHSLFDPAQVNALKKTDYLSHIRARRAAVATPKAEGQLLSVLLRIESKLDAALPRVGA